MMKRRYVAMISAVLCSAMILSCHLIHSFLFICNSLNAVYKDW